MFAPVFTRPVFSHVSVLLIGAILAPGPRTVTAALRVMGLANCPQFQNYHRVLNRDRWSSRAAARILLLALVAVFGESVLVFGIDETLERRRGKRIKAKGIYRDSVRSSHSHFVKSSGLRWISLMLLAQIPWADQIWALPVLTALAPSERYHTEQGKRHKPLTEWAAQMVSQLRHWLPAQQIVLVGDSTYAAFALLHHCASLRQPVTVVTRLRLDAALYAPAPERTPGTVGCPRKKGERLPTLETLLKAPDTRWQTITVPRWYSQGPREVEIVSGTAVWYHSGHPIVPLRWVLIRDPQGEFEPQALLCTDLTATPLAIISWFVRRWQMETTFHAVREHLGVETQRQWNDQAIARTTPALLALFSLVTLLAHPHFLRKPKAIRQASWYVKEQPTFIDALACVRRQIWRSRVFCMSASTSDIQQSPAPCYDQLIEALCYAA
jgi:hypothetical protein